MATQSITRSVQIKGRNACNRFLRAIEDSSRSKPKPVVFQRKPSDMTAQDVRQIFKSK